MSKTEDKNQVKDELFDKTTTEDHEGNPGDGSTTEEQGSTDEETNQDLQLDNPGEGEDSKAQAERDHQITLWKSRVESGKVSLEEVPHKWIKDAITSVPKEQNLDDVKKIVREEMEAERSEERFQSIRGQLNSMGLTSTQQSDIEDYYNEHLQYNMPKDVALEKAAKMAGVKDIKSKKMDETFKAMSMPKVGGPLKEKRLDDSPINENTIANMESADRMEMLEKARTGNRPTHNLRQ